MLDPWRDLERFIMMSVEAEACVEGSSIVEAKAWKS
jgi:hypothetical protein